MTSDLTTPESSGDSTVRRGRGRPEKFSTDDVIRTALGIGIDRFTLSGVAKQLNVTVQSVYRRFPTRHDLLEACIDTSLESVIPLPVPVPDLDPDPDPDLDLDPDLDPDPRPEQTWQDVTRAYADQWWALCLNYPGFSTVVSGYGGPLTRFLDGAFDSYLARLIELEWTRPQALFMVSQLIAAIARVDHFLAQAPVRDDQAVSESYRQVRICTEFIITGAQSVRPDWSL